MPRTTKLVLGSASVEHHLGDHESFLEWIYSYNAASSGHTQASSSDGGGPREQHRQHATASVRYWSTTSEGRRTGAAGHTPAGEIVVGRDGFQVLFKGPSSNLAELFKRAPS